MIKLSYKSKVLRESLMDLRINTNLFQNSGLNQIPTQTELSKIWFYANYFLNFRPLLGETHGPKFERKAKYINAICDTSSPNNGFAVYFKAFAQHKLKNDIDYQVISKLELILKESKFWREAFNELEISVENLKSSDLPIIPKFENWFSLFEEGADTDYKSEV
jgi:hypothetical protein